MDVVELRGVPLESGSMYPVKVLGAYAMIDCGELDWKLLCIRADHPLAPALHDIDDVERCARRLVSLYFIFVVDLAALTVPS